MDTDLKIRTEKFAEYCTSTYAMLVRDIGKGQ